MPEVAVDIKITCCECDEDLCGTLNVHDDGYGNGTLSITLPPCQKCMDDARDKSDSPSASQYSKLLGESFVREIERDKINAILAHAENCRADGRLSSTDIRVVLASCEKKLRALDEKGTTDAG